MTKRDKKQKTVVKYALHHGKLVEKHRLTANTVQDDVAQAEVKQANGNDSESNTKTSTKTKKRTVKKEEAKTEDFSVDS